MLNILTFDLEDWFMSSQELLPSFPPDVHELAAKKSMEYAYKNVKELLEILETHNTKATFFIFTKFAKLYPELIREIRKLGHEIGSHTHSHKLVYAMKPYKFKEDLQKSKDILENLIGEKINAFRAPYFSIKPGTEWAFEILLEVGFNVDSSIFPIKRSLYGYPTWNREPCIVEIKNAGVIYEFPISTIRLWNFNFPIGGGGYHRVLSYWFIKRSIKKINKQNNPAVIYFHPYEISVDELKDDIFKNIPIVTRFTQSFGRKTIKRKLSALLTDFEFTSLEQYIKLQTDYKKFEINNRCSF